MATYGRLWLPMAAYVIFGISGAGSTYGRQWLPLSAYGPQGEMAIWLALILYCFMQPLSSFDDDCARTLAQWVQWATAEGLTDIVLHGVVALQRKCLLFCRREVVRQKGTPMVRL